MIDSARVPLTNPHAQNQLLRNEIDGAIARVIESGQYILGPELEALEAEFAAYVGAKFAVGVANGTDGILLGLLALDIGEGDEVITVSHTAVATVSAIEQAGATAVLVDVEPGFLTMDPLLLEQALTDRTRAVMPVHIYGQAAEIAEIQKFCSKHGLALIEDVSQAHGARYGGARLGTFGVLGIFSCYPTKNLGALGDAGIIVTDNPDLADRLRRLRQYGWLARNSSLEPGINSRLDEIQAAILRVKLTYLDANNIRRRAAAARYSNVFDGLKIQVPLMRKSAEHVFHLYVLEVDNRDNFRGRLETAGVQTGIHYPVPVHLQPAYLGRIRLGSALPVTEIAARRIVSLPMFPELSQDKYRYVERVVCESLA